MTQKEYLEQSVSDAITQKPIQFSVKKRKFTISPPTLGKMQILSKLYLELDINEEEFSKEPHLEAIRICENRTDIVCQLMAVSTLSTQEEVLDNDKVSERAEFFKWNCYIEDFGNCLLAILTQADYSNFITSIRLTKMLRQNKPNSEGAVRVEQLGGALSGEAY